MAVASTGNVATVHTEPVMRRESERSGPGAGANLARVLVVVATGCGLGVAGELTVDGGSRPTGEGSDDATLSTRGGDDPGLAGDADGGAGDPAMVDDGGEFDALRGGLFGDVGDSEGTERKGNAPGTPEGGFPSHGAMGCPESADAATCDVSTSVCCTCPNCAIPFPTICLPSFPGCVPAGAYATLTCGSAANCTNASVCCASFNTTPTLTGASCEASCSVRDVQLCADTTECPSGRSCRALTSIPGFNGCQ